MLKILQNLIKSPISFFINRSTSSRFYIKNLLAMAGEGGKNKSDLNLEHLPVKKNKINSDDVPTRTVATMCGAWRPDEVDGGLIFVFKMREACLSPDPTKECDYPENIEDFWEASLMINDDIQVKGKSLTKEETKFLLELIEGSKIITSKTTNATNNKLKTEEWIRLTERFNATATNSPRTWQQLRLKWENLKKNARKRSTKIRMNQYCN